MQIYLLLFFLNIDYKLVIRFYDAKYYQNIFAHPANELCLLNIFIQYIFTKKNIAVDGLFQIIFINATCSSDWLINKLIREVFLYQDDHK